MWNPKPSFRFEIDNFSEKKDAIASHTFVSGGCEWYLYLPQKAFLSLFLSVANLKSLETGWKRSANFYFSVMNQSDKELYRSPIALARYPFCAQNPSRGLGSTLRSPFCAQNPSWGFGTSLPLSKFQEKGFLEKDRLIIEVYIKIFEAVDGEGGGVSKKKESVDIIGSQDYASQVALVRKIFAEYPEIAEEFKPKNQVVKRKHMNILRNACSKFSELVEVGLKLDWLKSKLGEFSLESKKADDKLGKVRLENKKADDADGSLVQHLDELRKGLELMEMGFKMDSCLKSKLAEVSLEKKNSYDVDGSRVQQLEERVKNLELMENGLRLDSLKSKLEEVSLEKKKSDADGSQVQQLEYRVKNLELMVSDLKVELDKKNAKSSGSTRLFDVEIKFY